MVEIATVNYELIKNYNNTEDVAYNFFQITCLEKDK